VADFQAARRPRGKLPRRAQMTVRLRSTPDLIGRLPRRIGQTVIGFALEADRVLKRASAKLRTKRLDVLIAQQANGEGSPFGRRPVHAWMLSKSGSVKALGARDKSAVARVVFDAIERLHARAGSCC